MHVRQRGSRGGQDELMVESKSSVVVNHNMGEGHLADDRRVGCSGDGKVRARRGLMIFLVRVECRWCESVKPSTE